MRFPSLCYQLERALAAHLPTLPPAQRRGLALWVYGSVLAQSACQTAVLVALSPLGSLAALRHRLRDWLYDGADKAAPCQTQVVVRPCFATLLRWVLTWWQGDHIAVAIDATTHQDRLLALVVSVLYRGSAIPVAWHLQPAHQPGAWMPHLLRLLDDLAPTLTSHRTVLVLADRGLWSPRLWQAVSAHGWHPLLRLPTNTLVQPTGMAGYRPAPLLVAGVGHAWVGTATVFKDRRTQQRGTLLVVWDAAAAAPWVLLTDLPPAQVGVSWYGLRMWIELGFRALKGVGWRWEHTRRTDPDRVARHWLVLAVATLWVLATGSRAEDADLAGRPPAHLHAPLAAGPPTRRRQISVFRRGLVWARVQCQRQYLWRRLWLRPDPWPLPPPSLHLYYHGPT
jgi:hypothetical protein